MEEVRMPRSRQCIEHVPQEYRVPHTKLWPRAANIGRRRPSRTSVPVFAGSLYLPGRVASSRPVPRPRWPDRGPARGLLALRPRTEGIQRLARGLSGEGSITRRRRRTPCTTLAAGQGGGRAFIAATCGWPTVPTAAPHRWRASARTSRACIPATGPRLALCHHNLRRYDNRADGKRREHRICRAIYSERSYGHPGYTTTPTWSE
jgi:hypothetical protein